MKLKFSFETKIIALFLKAKIPWQINAPVSSTNCVLSDGSQEVTDTDTVLPALQRLEFLANNMNSHTSNSTQPSSLAIQG